MLGEIISKRRSIQIDERDVKDHLSAIRKEMEEQGERKRQAQQVENDLAKKALKCRQDAEHWELKLFSLSDEYEKTFGEFNGTVAAYDLRVVTASKICSKIEFTRSSESIDAQIRKLTAELKEQSAK